MHRSRKPRHRLPGSESCRANRQKCLSDVRISMNVFNRDSRGFYSTFEGFLDMSKLMPCCCVAAMTIFTLGILAGPALAQEAKFDSDSISGLGARNIGSAAMSGR